MSGGSREQLQKIAEDWKQPPAEMVGHMPKGGTQVEYLGHALVTVILNGIDPFWTLEPVCDERGVPIVEQQGSDAVMWGRLTVLGHTRMGVGVCTAKAFDLHKQLLSDLLKNTAMRFGIGTMLWSREEFVAPAPPPEPAITAEQKGTIAAALASLSDEGKAHMKAFWKNSGFPSWAHKDDITESQAAQIIAGLEDWNTRSSVEPAEPSEGVTSGEVPATADPVDADAIDRQTPGATPGDAGALSGAARAALDRAKK